MFWGIWKNPKFELNSERREWVLRDIGGPSSVKWTVVAVLVDAVLAYLRWVPGQRQFNAAPLRTHRYKRTRREAGGLKTTPAKKNAKNRTT